MGHGIGYQADVEFLRDLFHNRGFPDPRIADQEDRSLSYTADDVISKLILQQISGDNALYLFLRFPDIHIRTSSVISLVSSTSFMAHDGTS